MSIGAVTAADIMGGGAERARRMGRAATPRFIYDAGKE